MCTATSSIAWMCWTSSANPTEAPGGWQGVFRMHARERIIRDRFAGQACGHCGTPYPPDGILVLARRPAAWMVMAICHECQNRSIFVVSFHEMHEAQDGHGAGMRIEPPLGEHLFPEADLPTDDDTSVLDDSVPLSASSSQRSPMPVTVSDVADMREFLADFQGDFRSLFERHRRRRQNDAGE